MSSSYVRTAIKQFLADNTNEDVVDLTSVYQEIRELLADSNIQPDSPWLGITFVGGVETPIALAATNDQGKYREFGAVEFHFFDVARLAGGAALLARGEALINLLRGSRIGDIIVDEMTMMNFDTGATLDFEGGYMSGTFSMVYRRDLDL